MASSANSQSTYSTAYFRIAFSYETDRHRCLLVGSDLKLFEITIKPVIPADLE